MTPRLCPRTTGCGITTSASRARPRSWSPSLVVWSREDAGVRAFQIRQIRTLNSSEPAADLDADPPPLAQPRRRDHDAVSTGLLRRVERAIRGRMQSVEGGQRRRLQI